MKGTPCPQQRHDAKSLTPPPPGCSREQFHQDMNECYFAVPFWPQHAPFCITLLLVCFDCSSPVDNHCCLLIKSKVSSPRAMHQANPCPLPLLLLPIPHATCIRSLLVVCRRTTNAITGALLSFCHAEFQLLITPLVFPWFDTGRLSNS